MVNDSDVTALNKKISDLQKQVSDFSMFQREPIDVLSSPFTEAAIRKIAGGGAIRNLGKTESTAAPTTTEYPIDGDFGVHVDTDDSIVYFAYNNAGTVNYVIVNTSGGGAGGGAPHAPAGRGHRRRHRHRLPRGAPPAAGGGFFHR